MRTVIIEASPHPGQAAVHDHTARFKVLAAGRRWGKTRLGVYECLDVAAGGGRAWWVAPNYKMSEVGWRPLRRMGAKIGAEVRKVDRQVLLPNGGEVTVRSADDPDSLRGEGLDFVVMDECAFMFEQAWTEALRPALSDRLGGAMFISTPKGHNWFWRVWTKGNDGHEQDWQAWQLPTKDNPYIEPKEIEDARRHLPERIFAQEYLAQFLEDAGGVFRRVMVNATSNELDVPERGHGYVFGVDWGQMNDFTVICVIDMVTNHLVYMDRFNQIDYVVQSSRLKALNSRFKPVTIIAELNSMGQPLVDQLSMDGLPIQGFKTTSATKDQIIRALQGAFERDEVKILPDDVLISELQAYQQERTAAGLWKYGAPEGMHDDTVMALSMAWYGTSLGGWDVF